MKLTYATRVKALRLLNNTNDLGSAIQMAMRFESQIIATTASEVRLTLSPYLAHSTC